MQTELNGLRVNYELEGSADSRAPCLVLSHCLGASLQLWEEQVRHLADSYRILRYDIRGHGGTEAPQGPYSMQGLADDIKSLLDKLELGRVHFAGISLGGMIGQVLALAYPQSLKSLVLCDTTCRVPPEMGPAWQERIDIARQHGMQPLVEPTLDRWLTPEFREKNPQTVERIAQMLGDTPVEGFVGCCQAISDFDVSERLHAVELPTRILVGENDPGTPVQESEAIQQRIPGAQLEVLPKARHLSCVEAAERFNHSLEEFLAGVEKGS